MPDGVSLDICSSEGKSSPSVDSFEEQHALAPQTAAELQSSIVDEEQQTMLPKTLDEIKEEPRFSVAEGAPSADAADLQPCFPQIPGYRLIKELGKGGMGVVYQAEQTKLHRLVALKMIRGGFVERQEYRHRFLVEAEAVARLQHPNIVQIYEVGDLQQPDGSVSPFMALEFVTGPSLESHLQGKPLTAQAAAELIGQLAFAMHYAHEHHLIHRDLKPANILLAPVEQGHSGLLQHTDSLFKRSRISSSLPFIPKITDFGLAKQIDVDSSQTKAGEIMGTPSYMAPEQAQAKTAVGPAADTYALGAILYELLTGRPPFRSVTSLDTLLMVIEEEPVPPSRLQSRIPRDLETICLKCLAKPIAKRYATSAELGEDLQRYLNQEPIKARPTTVAERLWKWAKRRPAIAALVIVSILALVTLIAGGLIFNQVVREERDVAIDAKKDAQIQRNDALKAKRQADDSAAETQRTLDFFAVATGLQQIDQGNLYRGLLWCSRPLQETGPYRQEKSIFRERLSHFLHFVNRPTLLQIFFADLQINQAAFTADGDWIATSHDNKTVQVWDKKSGKSIAPMLKDAGDGEVAFTPDRQRLLTVGGNAAQLWDTKTWKPAVAAMKHTGPVQRALFSPDYSQIVTASHDHTVRFWSSTTGEAIGPPLQLGAEVNDVAFALNGKIVATASGKIHSNKGELRLWDAKTHQPLGTVMNYPDAALHLAVSPDEKTLAGMSWDGTIRFLEIPSGAAKGPTLKISEGPRKIMFNPEGTHLAATSQSWNVNIFEVSTGRLLQNLNQADIVYGMDYTKDGKWIVSHGEDKTARVWDAKSGEPVTPSLPHRGAVTFAVWHPSSRQLLTCSDDGTARLWDVPSRQAKAIELKHASWLWVVAVSSDGTVLATGGDNKDVHLWKLPNGEPMGGPLQFPGLIRELSFHPSKHWLAISGEHNEAHIFDLDKRALAFSPLKHDKRVMSVRFSPDGKWLATTSLDGSAKIWSTDDGRLVNTLPHKAPVISISFSPDAMLVLTTCGNGTVWLWDRATGKERFAPWKHGDSPVVSGAFSPDGQWAATCSYDYTAKIWNIKTGAAMLPPLQHQYEVMTLAFHPNSHRLVTGSYDKTGRIWDVETCQSVGPPLQHQAWVTQAQFSPDGHLVATTSRDRSARLWDSSSGQAISPPLPHEGRPVTECFTPDGRLLITGGFDKIARVWPMPEETRPTADLIDLIELYDGHRLTKLGGVEQLTNDEMKTRWQRLRTKYPEEFRSDRSGAR